MERLKQGAVNNYKKAILSPTMVRAGWLTACDVATIPGGCPRIIATS